MIWEPKEDDPAFKVGIWYGIKNEGYVSSRIGAVQVALKNAFWQGVWWQRDQERLHRTFPSVAFEAEDRT